MHFPFIVFNLFSTDFAEAFQERGLCEIALGQKERECLYLPKYGDLGYYEAYNAIKDLYN